MSAMLDYISEKLASFATLKPGWDSYKGLPPTTDELAFAGALAAAMVEHPHVTAIDITPLLDGGLSFEAKVGARLMSVEIVDLYAEDDDRREKTTATFPRCSAISPRGRCVRELEHDGDHEWPPPAAAKGKAS